MSGTKKNYIKNLPQTRLGLVRLPGYSCWLAALPGRRVPGGRGGRDGQVPGVGGGPHLGRDPVSVLAVQASFC